MKYMKLDQKGSAMAEYIWIDSTGGVRSKSKVSEIILYPHPWRGVGSHLSCKHLTGARVFLMVH
jgi:hypothetical protein